MRREGTALAVRELGFFELSHSAMPAGIESEARQPPVRGGVPAMSRRCGRRGQEGSWLKFAEE
jgi:hypothetical protein